MFSRFLLLFLIEMVSCSGDWSYEGSSAPYLWGEDCQLKHQSPIDIVTDRVEFNPGLLKPRLSGYDQSVGVVTLSNNGHSVSLALPNRLPGNGTINMALPTIAGTFQAASLHFHWGTSNTKGSEHTVDSKEYPMEMHIVHMNTKYSSLPQALKHGDGLAVLGYFFEETATNNDNFNPITDNVVSVPQPGDTKVIGGFALQDLMLPDKDSSSYWRYNGSLTTPPCSEVITWTVFTTPIKIGKKQMDLFRKSVKLEKGMYNNFRPVQPINGRVVFTGDSSLVGAAIGVTSSILLVISCAFLTLRTL